MEAEVAPVAVVVSRVTVVVVPVTELLPPLPRAARTGDDFLCTVVMRRQDVSELLAEGEREREDLLRERDREDAALGACLVRRRCGAYPDFALSPL